jgi:hypothetical protein
VIFTLDSYHVGDERDSKTHLRCQYLVSEMSGKLHNLLVDSFVSHLIMGAFSFGRGIKDNLPIYFTSIAAGKPHDCRMA